MLRTTSGWLLALALVAPACSDFDAAGGGGAGDFGATQGGVQDMGLARELIAEGIVPPAEAFPVEGMFSEHDLGLTGAPCSTLLCLRAALGVAPALDGEPAAWLQVGMSSTIDPDTYERPTQTLIMTVDVSGSMGWDYSADQPTPGALSRRLLHDIGAQLGAGDRFAIVTYGSNVRTRLGLRSATDQDGYHDEVDALDEAGSTNMEAGLERAYAIAASAVADGETDEVRVVLYTDVRPNTGASTPTEFDLLVKQGAEDGVGLTVLALGQGLGQDVLLAIADVRGGNAFSLFDFEDADDLMADHWPWMVSPIAYDLSLAVDAGESLQVAEAYGFPGDNQLEIEAATVFLSKKKGALLAQLAPALPDAEAIDAFTATGELRYTTPALQSISQPIEVSWDGTGSDERGHYADQPSVAKTTALAILVDAMGRAAEIYAADPDGAVSIMSAAHARFAADAEALDDPALAVEVELAAALLALMEQGAPQDDPYYP